MIIGNTTLTLTEEQGMLMDVAREFCRDKSPVSAVREQLDTELGFDTNIWKEMIALGWTGIALPEHCGGSGLGVSALVPVFEAMGRALLGTPLLTTSLAAQLIMRASGAAQESRLTDIASGTVATLALNEDADWGREHFAVSLDKSGTLSGMKRFVPDADGG